MTNSHLMKVIFIPNGATYLAILHTSAIYTAIVAIMRPIAE